VVLSPEELERLRRSGVKLDADGRFWHEGEAVTHPGVISAFWRWLDRNPDGRYVLRLDEERFVYVEVEGTPHVVRSLRWIGDRALGRLADDSEEELALESLRVVGDGVDESVRAYVRVKGGRFEAKISASAWGVLMERIVERDGRAWLDVAGGPYPL